MTPDERRIAPGDGPEATFARSMLERERTAKPHRDPDAPPRPPSFWNTTHTQDHDPPAVWGQYPRGFVQWALASMGCSSRSATLHVCSGALPPGEGLRVDIRSMQHPDVVADGQSLPFRDSSFAAVLIDPPYSREHAAQLYGTPNFSLRAMVNEALRVVRPNCCVGVLAHTVPFYDRDRGSLARVIGVTTGSGYRIRAFSVLRRHQHGLFDGGAA